MYRMLTFTCSNIYFVQMLGLASSSRLLLLVKLPEPPTPSVLLKYNVLKKIQLHL